MHQNASQEKGIDARIRKERQRWEGKVYALFQRNMGTFRTFLDINQFNTPMLDQRKSPCVLNPTTVVRSKDSVIWLCISKLPRIHSVPSHTIRYCLIGTPMCQIGVGNLWLKVQNVGTPGKTHTCLSYENNFHAWCKVFRYQVIIPDRTNLKPSVLFSVMFPLFLPRRECLRLHSNQQMDKRAVGEWIVVAFVNRMTLFWRQFQHQYNRCTADDWLHFIRSWLLI